MASWRAWGEELVNIGQGRGLMEDRSSGRRRRSHVLGRPVRYRVSGLPKRDMERMATNILVICAASAGVTTIAVKIASGCVVGCKNCFAEGSLNECLVDDETERAVVRVRGQFV